MLGWRTLAAAFAATFLVAPALAESDESARIDALEREVAELRRLLEDRGADVERLVADANARPAAHELHADPSGDSMPNLSANAFGDFTYLHSRSEPIGGGHSRAHSFAVGDFSLFLSSELSPDISFATEIVLEAERGGVHVDIERLIADVRLDRGVGLKVGRGHTALSFWNQTFHHGSYLQTSIATPLILGKLLPRHFSGVELYAQKSSELGIFDLRLEAANGRAARQGAEQNTGDLDKGKMLSLVGSVRPAALEGFGFDLGITRDQIPSDPSTPGRERGMDETIASLSVHYEMFPWELLGEFHWVEHDDHTDGREKQSSGGYAQIAYTMEQFTPYYRVDWLERDERDLFYGFVDDTVQHTAGLRVDWTRYSAVKVEYRRLDDAQSDAHSVLMNLSFGF